MPSGDQIDFVDAVRVGRHSYALWREWSAPLLVVEDLASGRCRRISLPFPFRIERYSAATMGDRYLALEIGAQEVAGFFVLDTRRMAPALVVESAGGRLLLGSGSSLWQYCPGEGLYRVQPHRSRLRRSLFAADALLRSAGGDAEVVRGCASTEGATLLLANGTIVGVSPEEGTPRSLGSLGARLPDVRCAGRVEDHVAYVTVDAPDTLKCVRLSTGEEKRASVPFEVGMLRPLGNGAQLALWSLGASHAEIWDAVTGRWVTNGVGVPVEV